MVATFKDVVGHESIIGHFKSSIEKDKVAHAYLIHGEKGTGKKMLAGLFAKTLQCEVGGTDPCCKCRSCIQCDTGNHPDIRWITHDKTVISVDDIREQINKDVLTRPYSSRYKIYIVPDADLMNPQAQNALLKTLEEPPSYVVVLLLTNNIERMLPTIISRSITLNLKPVGELDLLEYLGKIGIPMGKAKFCVGFASGNLGKAVRLATSEDYNSIKQDCVGILKNINRLEIYDLIESVKKMSKYKLDVYDYIDLMMMWYRDILMLKVAGSPDKLLFKEEYTALKQQANHISFEGIENVLEAMDKVKVRLEANVNFDIAMELLLLTIKENQK
ncbi:MAG: DNA polymerase III subunit delta' [Lachnospiraceae bacterium]|nr:DNA polymerase III subunit delta' [Lachnospiraceae bacterium]